MTRRFGREDDTAGTSAAAPRATGSAPGGAGRPDMADAKATVDRFGNILVDVFQLVALFVIGGTIVWSAGHEYLHMIREARRAVVQGGRREIRRRQGRARQAGVWGAIPIPPNAVPDADLTTLVEWILALK